MSQKSNGINSERELLHMFWKESWAAYRVAGSGAIKYPAPDLIAGNGFRRIVLECKQTKSDKKYISKDQINELREVAKFLASEPWVAVRFPRKKWFFFSLDDLDDTGKNYSVNIEKGVLFNDLIES